jgi:uridine monophosphate synthetase
MPTFFEKLDQRAREINSLLCVNLSPDMDTPPNTASEAKEHCIRLVNATSDHALAFTLNSAFYETFGTQGLEALQSVIQSIPKDIPVILDAKRGDIGSAARAYAHGGYEMLGAHAITLSPYLGYDSITPFMENPEKGAFLVCKTSNPGSVDLQDLPLGGHYRLTMVYEKIAGLATEWGTANNLGLVVNADFPDSLRRVREISPEQWLLVSGQCTQQNRIKTSLLAGLRSDGLGLLIDPGHQITCANDPGEAARKLVGLLRDAQQDTHPQPKKLGQPLVSMIPLVEGLLSMGCIRFGEFTLKSGAVAPIQIDLRRLVSFPGWMTQVAAAYIRKLKTLTFDRLAGIPYTALPITTAVSLLGNWPLVYPRKTTSINNGSAVIEGLYYEGETAVVINDLVITGGSIFEAIERFQQVGLKVSDVVVLINLEAGAQKAIEKAGYRLHALFTLTQLLDYWEATGRMPAEQINPVRDFLSISNQP